MADGERSRDVATSTGDEASVIDNLIRRRFACRRFTDKYVSRETIEQILDVARFAASSSNGQPWHVFVVAGELKLDISRSLLHAHAHEPDQHVPEQQVSTPIPALYASRREEYGRTFYGYLGVNRADMVARAAVTARNYAFFDAPVGLIFTIDRRLGSASWVDLGLFLQNIMLAACSRGLDTCTQETFAKYHRLLREPLRIPPEQIVVCGMSIGFADHQALQGRPTNSRAPVSDFANFLGFEVEQEKL